MTHTTHSLYQPSSWGRKKVIFDSTTPNHNQSPIIHRIFASNRKEKRWLHFRLSVVPRNDLMRLHKLESNSWYLSLTHLIQFFHVPNNLLWVFHLQYGGSYHHSLLFVLKSEINEIRKMSHEKEIEPLYQIPSSQYSQSAETKHTSKWPANINNGTHQQQR